MWSNILIGILLTEIFLLIYIKRKKYDHIKSKEKLLEELIEDKSVEMGCYFIITFISALFLTFQTPENSFYLWGLVLQVNISGILFWVSFKDLYSYIKVRVNK